MLTLYGVGLSAILWNSIIVTDFESSMNVGLGMIGWGLVKLSEYRHLLVEEEEE